ncbi:MAG: DUF4019 domain-containing protein [Pseudomonadota bacterium]
MSEALGDLTEKEKEALRLLLSGHDTKSSARELDISVHTVNDRLRNARRKLSVGSSREAARILGDAEGETFQITPQNPVRTSSGIAPEAALADNADLSQAEPSRFIWLAGGMLIMSIVIAAAIIAVVSSSGGEASTVPAAASSASTAAAQEASRTASDEASPAALKRARTFISAVDAGDWQESWSRSGEFFQSQTSATEWAALVEPVRGPLGSVEKRRLVSVERVSTLPGAPEGDYEILQYQTEFEKLEGVSTETVILIRNGEDFDIAGFFIR